MTASISNIAEHAGIFNETAQEAGVSIEEMIASIKETAGSIEILSASSEDSTTALAEVNTSIAEIQQSAEESVRLAEKVSVDASEKGITSISMAIGGMDDIKESVTAISETIDRLEKRSEEIGNILDVIDGVASQTSLLSLNAAILAAQAGENGKAFAVVADEIKNLADRTSASTKEIAELITGVQAETRSSVEKATSTIKTVDRGVELFKEVNSALKSILESSNVSTAMTKAIKRATSEEAIVIGHITNAIRKITQQIEQISKATKEQSKGSSMIGEATGKIKDISDHIKKATEEQFKGSDKIASVTENVSRTAEQITLAINSQKKKSNDIVNIMEKIQKTTADLVTSASEMDRSITTLSKGAKNLLTEIQKFKV